MMRYFENSLPDFVPGATVEVERDRWKDITVEAINKILKHNKPKKSHCDGGIYVGCAGIAYALYHVSITDAFSSQKIDLLEIAMDYANVSMKFYKKYSDDPSCSFLLGRAGISAMCCVLNDMMGKRDQSLEQLNKVRQLAKKMQPVTLSKHGSDELFVGRAGYICMTLFLSRHFKDQYLFRDEQELICKSIIRSGRAYAKEIKSPSPLMYSYYKTEYLGAAHGLSSILLMLLNCPNFLNSHSSAADDVRGSVDYLISILEKNGNTAVSTSDVGQSTRGKENDDLVHWCHGAPGVVYVFAKAYLCYKKERYLDACLICGELVWKAGLLRKGPGLCHGVSGNAYVFLLLYRLTGDHKHLHRAQSFADFMLTREFKDNSRTPDSPFSLFEGLAGTVCFLSDLIQPHRAAFPFFDIFS